MRVLGQLTADPSMPVEAMCSCWMRRRRAEVVAGFDGAVVAVESTLLPDLVAEQASAPRRRRLRCRSRGAVCPYGEFAARVAVLARS